MENLIYRCYFLLAVKKKKKASVPNMIYALNSMGEKEKKKGK